MMTVDVLFGSWVYFTLFLILLLFVDVSCDIGRYFIVSRVENLKDSQIWLFAIDKLYQ